MPSQPPRPLRLVGLAYLVLLNLLLRLALLPLNHAEYTDGYLQLLVFQIKSGLYPPLFGALATGISALGLPMETAGRLVSIIAASLTVIPLHVGARMMAGRRAALWCVLLYTVSPLPARWGLRVMTDSLFLLLSASSLVLCVGSARYARPLGKRRCAIYLTWATALAILATLTRWQGLALAPCVALSWWQVMQRLRTPLLPVVFTQLLWAVPVIWAKTQGFAHTGQFTSRTAQNTTTTLLAYGNTLESFILIAPYFIGYPIVLWAAAWLFRTQRNTTGIAAWYLPWGVWSIAILAAQSAFGSFQYRYMLPLLPPIWMAAGAAIARLESTRPARARVLALLSILFLTCNTAAVLWFHRQAIGDQRAAAVWAATDVPKDVALLSNERYGDFRQLGCVKMSFWTQRRVSQLATPQDFPNLRKGEIAVALLSNAYGGDEALTSIVEALRLRYDVRTLGPPFEAEVVPLHDDVMVRPFLNQNPMAWVMRYVPQQFKTIAVRIEGK